MIFKHELEALIGKKVMFASGNGAVTIKLGEGEINENLRYKITQVQEDYFIAEGEDHFNYPYRFIIPISKIEKISYLFKK